MGIDISVFTEVKKDNKWHSADEWIDYGDTRLPHVKEPFYNGRNYTLFTILGNFYSETILPITETQRGIPKDISEDLIRKQIVRADGSGGWYFDDLHSPSWNTLEELLNYPWDLPEKLEDAYVKKDDPKIWHYNSYDIKDCKDEYEVKTIEEPLRELCSCFVNKTIPRLQKLDENPQNVRIIYGFD